MCSALSFYISSHTLEKKRHPLQLSPFFPSSFFSFPQPVFFLSTQFTEAMEWLPGSLGVAPELQVCRLEVAELSVAVEGDSPWWNINISPYWFTAVWPNMTQYWAKWVMSMSPSLQFSLRVMTKGMNRDRGIKKGIIFYYSALQRQISIQEKFRRNHFKFKLLDTEKDYNAFIYTF